MKSTAKIIALGLSSALLLAACTTGTGSSTSNQDIGTIGGGAIGGLLGSQFGQGNGKVASAVAGTLLGAFIGGNVGKSMDEVDKMKTSQSLETEKTGQTSTWENPDNHNTYSVKPTKTVTQRGIPCRYYTMTVIYDDGTKDVIDGKACRERVANGRFKWQNIN
jgi:surface antigen